MLRDLLLATLLLAIPALAGCTTPAPAPAQGACPTGDGFLVIAVQTGGLSPHPEVFTVEASGLATGVVLAHGAPANGTVGVPERSLHNITPSEVHRVLAAADQPDQGRWNTTLAFQGTASAEDLEALCEALTESAPEMQPRYPDTDCRDGTTLSLTAWTPQGLQRSTAECEAGLGTPFDAVRLAARNATETARDQAGVPS